MNKSGLIAILLLFSSSACTPVTGGTTLPADNGAPISAEPSGGPVLQSAESPTATVTPAVAQPEATPTMQPIDQRLAYIGGDGNLWLLDLITGGQQQLTSDGRSMFSFSQEKFVTYQQPAWSSDGRFLAYERTTYTPLADRTDIKESLWMYDDDSGEMRLLLEDMQIPGFAWKPQTHLIAYSEMIDPNYFTGRGTVDASLANGILGLDVDSGETLELVKPQGFSLINPQWSADGRFLSFDEVYLMEGGGNFAYYDFENGETIRWERPIGTYSWSPDSRMILYDNLTYTPNGEERIFINNRMGTEEKVLSPVVENSYASFPVYSADGSLVAYRIASLLEDGQPDSLMVIPAAGGEAHQAAELVQISRILWSAGGDHLVVSTGPYDTPNIVQVDLDNGEVKVLADGWQPAWQPLPLD